jgi:putative hydrolase
MLGCRSKTSGKETNALGEHGKTLSVRCWYASSGQGSVYLGRALKLDENLGRDELERLLRQMLGEAGTDAEIARIAGLWQNPAALGQMFSQARAMFSGSDEPVNWKLASDQAQELAKKDQLESAAVAGELNPAFEMATLWLQETTEFSTSQPLKVLSRSAWVEDAMTLYKELSEPVAISMSKALSENMDKLMPEELSQMLGPAKSFISNAGAAIFAMQLGQAVGKLSSQTLTGSEIGIPISQRPSLVAQNISELIAELPTPKSEVLIYLATRELALSALYNSNRWLSDQIITQVREFAAGLKVDVESIQNLAESIDPSDPESVNQIMQAGSLITQRSEEQEAALSRIELMLALIEGWADYVTELSCKRLPSLQAISELFQRHRATSGALEKTFETLLGLQLQPKLRREAKAMWQLVDQHLGSAIRDSLWLHPDQLPAESEVTDPATLITRLGSEGDDFDAQLRKLLDG